MEKEEIIELENKCKIEMDREGNIYMSDCPPRFELGRNDIEMINKIKDIILEDE